MKVDYVYMDAYQTMNMVTNLRFVIVLGIVSMSKASKVIFEAMDGDLF